MRISRFLLTGVVVAVVAVAAGVGVVQTVLAQGNEPPQAANRPRVASDSMPPLPAHVREASARLGLQLDTSRNIAQGVYLASKTDGELCLITTSHGMSMGCGPGDSYFGSNALQYGIAEQGKPEAPTALTIYGVARPDVTSVRVIFPSRVVDADITKDGGFSISATDSQLQQGRPTQLLALDASGQTVQTFALPQH